MCFLYTFPLCYSCLIKLDISWLGELGVTPHWLWLPCLYLMRLTGLWCILGYIDELASEVLPRTYTRFSFWSLSYTLVFPYLLGRYVSRFRYILCNILFHLCYEPFYFKTPLFWWIYLIVGSGFKNYRFSLKWTY